MERRQNRQVAAPRRPPLDGQAHKRGQNEQRDAAREFPDERRPRIEIRDGASALFVRPAEIAWVEAAGNYVEFHLGARRRMVRGTLAAWEDKLGPLGFVRAHRSRIVNRAHIRGIRPTPSGDMAITLEDGRELAASRRYRAQLESAEGVRARG